MFYNDYAFLKHWHGPPIKDCEDELVPSTLGKNRQFV